VLVDLAGQTQPDTLTALINEMDVFISTDSGPYHIAVALQIPTLCWLTYDERSSYHSQSWVRCIVKPECISFINALDELIR
jgi:ADP-heptose:LPS heptosyltransferase